MKAIITLLIITLSVSLSGCGNDTEETVSVQIPILLKNEAEEGMYAVSVTITGTGMKPIRTEQDLVFKRTAIKFMSQLTMFLAKGIGLSI